MPYRLRSLRPLFFLLIASISPAQTKEKAHSKPDIILITIDTTRADRMGFLGSDRGLTPSLDALANESTIFTHAYSHAPLTTPSHATILTGTYPQYNHVNDFGMPLEKKIPYLPDILSRQGYRTAAFVGSIVLDPKRPMCPGFDRGFAVYDAGFHSLQAHEDRYSSVERRAGDVIARVQTWLNTKPSRPGPLFLWVHLYDPHDPYDPPEPFRSKFSDRYDGEIAYTDAMLGRLFAELRTARRYDNSLIAVMADHGEAFGEHGERSHGILLQDATLHVPLLIKLPKTARLAAETESKVDTPVGLVDISPTVLQIVGIPVPKEMQGQSLLPLMRREKTTPPISDRPLYAETDYPFHCFRWSALRAIRTSKYFYVEAPRRELYDLVSDPKAEKNIASSSPAIAETLREKLLTFRKSTTLESSSTVKLDPAAMANLTALGYTSSPNLLVEREAIVGGIDPKDRIETANLFHDGVLDVEIGKFQEAVSNLEQVIQTEPNLPAAFVQLGTALTRLRSYEKALPVLKRALELNPNEVTHYELGLALSERGEWKQSAEHFEQALKLNPRWVDAHFSLAAVYTHLDRIPEAIQEFGKTLELNPNHFQANLLRGWYLANQGSASEALPNLKKAAELQPNSKEAHQYLADAYEQLGDAARAAEEHSKAEALSGER